MSKLLCLTSLNRTDMIREKTDEIYLDQQRVIQLLNEKIARVQKDAENMAADFHKEREWLERQESQASSNGGDTSSFAARALNVALQVGAGVASVAYMYGRFMAPGLPPAPPPPPPGVAAQVLTAVVNLFKHIH